MGRSGRSGLRREEKGIGWSQQAASLDWLVPPAPWQVRPRVPIVSLERCMAVLCAQDIKAHRTGFGSFGSNTVPNRLLGVSGIRALSSVLAFSCSR